MIFHPDSHNISHQGHFFFFWPVNNISVFGLKIIAVALCAHRRACSFVYVCVGRSHTHTHTHTFTEREKECVWECECLFCVSLSPHCSEAACLHEQQKLSYLRSGMGNTGFTAFVLQKPETHEADSVQHANVRLKIEAQHRISEAARRRASAFMVAVWETKKKRGWGLWLVELNKDCAGVRVILLLFSLSVTPLSLSTPVCATEGNIMHSLNSYFWPLPCLD